jgi:Uma2 family endonuclease
VRHQRISREVQFRLMSFLRGSEVGEVFDAPIGLRLDDEVVLEPDLLVVLARHAGNVGVLVIDAPVDLVVEVLSPGTATRDLGSKRRAYEQGGVHEYWIVDPEAAAIEVLTLSNGRYARHGLYRRGETLTSVVLPGLEIPVSEVVPAR